MPTRGSVLIVDDVPANLQVLVDALSGSGFDVFVAKSGESALELLDRSTPDIILLDVKMPGIDGFETCRRLKAADETKDIPVIFMTGLTDTLDKVRGFGIGAVDYVTKPIEHEEMLARVRAHVTIQRLRRELEGANHRLEERVERRTEKLTLANERLQVALAEVEALKNRLQAENIYLLEEIKGEHGFGEIVGESPALEELLHVVKQVAPTDATVLIQGETGTGKELVARAIHDRSRRRNRALVKVHCGSISAGLVESELFGHEKGAFTGALRQRVGRFELADGGTIFLDEVGELPPQTQVKLLRVLQEMEFERVGSSEPMRVDVRVIAASNRDLADAVKAGRFREDLFYRLSVFPVRVPALRERRSDIPLLVRFFVEQFARRIGKRIEGVTESSMNRLVSYPWPGNVRELQNVIERAVILAARPVIEIGEVSSPGTTVVLDSSTELEPSRARTLEGVPQQSATLAEMERSHTLRVLAETNWQIGGDRGAARILGLHPNTLRSRMKKLGVRRPSEPERP